MRGKCPENIDIVPAYIVNATKPYSAIRVPSKPSMEKKIISKSTVVLRWLGLPEIKKMMSQQKALE